jgi:DNA-binding NarL/FixJ family response regulator
MEDLGLRTGTRAHIRTAIADFRAALQLPTELADDVEREFRDPAETLYGVRSFSEACGFSAREREAVLALVHRGSRAKVAEHLGVSEGTVHTCRSRAYVKAGVRTEMAPRRRSTR